MTLPVKMLRGFRGVFKRLFPSDQPESESPFSLSVVGTRRTYPSTFAARRELALAFLHDPEWRERISQAQSIGEFGLLLAEYARSKGEKVLELPL